MGKWLDSMQTMLGCVDNERVEACSISLVPERVRKSKVEAYVPQVVSIGPLHRGKRTELLYMENLKWRCMMRLLHRSEDPVSGLEEIGEAILKLDEVVRANYRVDDVGFNPHDLAKIMLLDCCFLLELLICSSPELNEQLKCSIGGPSPGPEIIKREKVLSDLMMLENQIPFVVLHVLLQKLFPKSDVSLESLKAQAVSMMLGYDPSAVGSTYSQSRAFHLLGLLHSFIHMEKCEIGHETTEEFKIFIDPNDIDRKEILPRCATRLDAAGIIIQSKPAEKTGFNLKITFSVKNGKAILEIPQLHITETTETKWRNFIAWELTQSRLEKLSGKRAIYEASELKNEVAGISCQFLHYAKFFNSLICCVEDVTLLRDRGVIVTTNYQVKTKNGKIDEYVLDLFRDLIRDSVSLSDMEMINVDPWIYKVAKDLNSYNPSGYDCSCVGGSIRIMWHIFTGALLTTFCYNWKNSFRVLRREYIPTRWRLIAVLAAATGLLLTAVQTVYSARGN